MDLRHKQGAIESTGKGFINAETACRPKEFRWRPGAPGVIPISPDVFTMRGQEASQRIRPKNLRVRETSPLIKYLNENNLGDQHDAYMAQHIDQDEITIAIGLLTGKKSVGKCIVDAEVIKENQEWITPILEIGFQNCQNAYKMPKNG